MCSTYCLFLLYRGHASESCIAPLLQAAYMVTSAGQHEITVLAGGKPVAGSPFTLNVAPGQTRAGSCRLTGPGMHSVQLGREMRLAVHLADSFGNAIADPGALEAHHVQVCHRDLMRHP